MIFALSILGVLGLWACLAANPYKKQVQITGDNSIQTRRDIDISSRNTVDSLED